MNSRSQRSFPYQNYTSYPQFPYQNYTKPPAISLLKLYLLDIDIIGKNGIIVVKVKIYIHFVDKLCDFFEGVRICEIFVNTL